MVDHHEIIDKLISMITRPFNWEDPVTEELCIDQGNTGFWRKCYEGRASSKRVSMENVKRQTLPRTPEEGHDFKGPVALILSVVAPTLFSSMDLLVDPQTLTFSF